MSGIENFRTAALSVLIGALVLVSLAMPVLIVGTSASRYTVVFSAVDEAPRSAAIAGEDGPAT